AYAAKSKVLIYYANETHLSKYSKNSYSPIFNWLDFQPEHGLGQKIKTQVENDLRDFPDAVRKELADNDEAASRSGQSVVSFTNQLASNRKFLEWKDGRPREGVFSFPSPDHYIGRSQPLSEPTSLSAALDLVREKYRPEIY